MNLFYKYYTANVVTDDSGPSGSYIVRVPFWKTANQAYREIKEIIDTNKASLVDFRRVE